MRIVLGVSAGIAAYKAVLLLRLMREAGHQVDVIPTPASEKFVGRATWEAISGRPVTTSVFSGVDSHAFLWRPDGDRMVGVNHDATRRQRRQDRSPEVRETGAFYAFRADRFAAVDGTTAEAKRAQRDLGVDVPDGVVEAYEAVVDRVDLESIAGRELVTHQQLLARRDRGRRVHRVRR